MKWDHFCCYDLLYNLCWFHIELIIVIDNRLNVLQKIEATKNVFKIFVFQSVTIKYHPIQNIILFLKAWPDSFGQALTNFVTCQI